MLKIFDIEIVGYIVLQLVPNIWICEELDLFKVSKLKCNKVACLRWVLIDVINLYD